MNEAPAAPREIGVKGTPPGYWDLPEPVRYRTVREWSFCGLRYPAGIQVFHVSNGHEWNRPRRLFEIRGTDAEGAYIHRHYVSISDAVLGIERAD